MALASGNDFDVLEEYYSNTHFQLLITVEQGNINLVKSLGEIDGLVIKPASEGIIFLWDTSQTMSSELQQYPDHFDQIQPSLINGSYDIQMYSFNVEPEKILEWTADTENAKPVLKKLVQQNLGSKSIFFPSIERVIQDSVQELEKSYDVLHMYTYSDGWDDGHYQQNTKEVIPYSDAEIKWLKTVFSHPKIHSHVALFNTCDECKGLKRPIAMKHLRQVCAQIETPVSNMTCTFDEEPNPPSKLRAPHHVLRRICKYT